MNIKQLLVYLGKLILCGLAYFIGIMISAMVTAVLHLPQPPIPEGVDQATAAIALLLVSPLLAFALVLIARNITGNWLTRAAILSGLTYIAYTLNNILDAAIYLTAYDPSSAFMTSLPSVVPSLLCGGTVALLFPPEEKGSGFVTAWKEFFSQRNAGQWLWRLLLASVAFIPVYLLFGLLVNPITGEYYRQNMYGLKAAGWDQILPIQFLRSLLFLLACLPIFIAWQKSESSLFLRLGIAQFILINFLYTLISYWLPLFVRIPHALEVFADSFVYTGLLTWLLLGRLPFIKQRHIGFQTQ
jgi:hypothetical protein